MTSKQALMFPVPDWIPPDSWAGFVEMRTAIKAPLTDRSIALIVKRLDELRHLGYDPGAVLDQSTVNDWRGVFPIREESRSAKGKESVFEQSIRKYHAENANQLAD